MKETAKSNPAAKQQRVKFASIEWKKTPRPGGCAAVYAVEDCRYATRFFLSASDLMPANTYGDEREAVANVQLLRIDDDGGPVSVAYTSYTLIHFFMPPLLRTGGPIITVNTKCAPTNTHTHTYARARKHPHHLGALDVLLGVHEVLHKRLLRPGDTWEGGRGLGGNASHARTGEMG